MCFFLNIYIYFKVIINLLYVIFNLKLSIVIYTILNGLNYFCKINMFKSVGM